MEDIKYLDHKEVQKLLAGIQSVRDRLMFTLMYAYGMRVSELLNITLDDIDLKDKTLKIVPLKRKDKNKYIFKLTDNLVKMIKDWTKIRPKTNSPYLIVARRYKDNKPVYDRMSRVTAYNLFKGYCVKSGNDERFCHPHTLRHSFAVACATSGMDIYTTKEMLRHSSISSTECYYRIANKDRDKRIGKLHNLLGL